MVFLIMITWILKVNGWQIPAVIWVVEGILLWLKAMAAIFRVEAAVEKIAPEKKYATIGTKEEDDLK